MRSLLNLIRSLLKFAIPRWCHYIFTPFQLYLCSPLVSSNPNSPEHRIYVGPNHRLTLSQALMLQLELSKSVRRLGWLGNYYEFGCFGGVSLIMCGQLIKYYSIFYKEFKDIKIFAFDSFEGLPENQKGDPKDPVWKKGEFYGSLEQVKRNVAEYRINNIEYIKGFYENSLTEELAEKMKECPPSIIYIDVDMYSSTITVLNWIDKIALPGTIIYFDDVWGTGNHPESGEQKAIIEYNALNTTRCFLTEDPTSYGSKSVFRFLLKDPEKNAQFKGYE